MSNPPLNILSGQQKGTKNVWSIPLLETVGKAAVGFVSLIFILAGNIITDQGLGQCLVRMCSNYAGCWNARVILKASDNIKPVWFNCKKSYLMLLCLKVSGALRVKTKEWTQPYFTLCCVDCVNSNLNASITSYLLWRIIHKDLKLKRNTPRTVAPEIHCHVFIRNMWELVKKQTNRVTFVLIYTWAINAEVEKTPRASNQQTDSFRIKHWEVTVQKYTVNNDINCSKSSHWRSWKVTEI